MEVPLNIFDVFVLGGMKWLVVVVLDSEAVVRNLGYWDGGDGAGCMSDGCSILNRGC